MSITSTIGIMSYDCILDELFDIVKLWSWIPWLILLKSHAMPPSGALFTYGLEQSNLDSLFGLFLSKPKLKQCGYFCWLCHELSQC